MRRPLRTLSTVLTSLALVACGVGDDPPTHALGFDPAAASQLSDGDEERIFIQRQLAFGPNGDALAIYRSLGNGSHQIHLRRFVTATGQFGNPRDLGRAASGKAENLRLKADATIDVAVATWAVEAALPLPTANVFAAVYTGLAYGKRCRT